MKTLALLGILLVVTPGLAQSGTDPGARDSVWVESVTWNGNDPFSTLVYAQTDDSLEQATVVLTWGTTQIQIDSVTLEGSRWQTVVSNDSGVLVSTDGLVGGVSDGEHHNLSFLPYTRLLAPGSGPVCKVFWSRTGAVVTGPPITVDSATTTSGSMTSNSLLFGSTPQAEDNYTPAFGPGTITIVPCDCPSQVDNDSSGFVDATDLAYEIDIVFFGGVDVTDPVCPTSRGDFNCDGFADATDLAYLIDFVFFGGDAPCNPCAL